MKGKREMKKKTFHSVVALFLAIVMLLAVTACTDPTSAPTTPTESKPGPTQPGTQPSETEGPQSSIVPGTSFKYWTNYDIPAYLPWMDNRGSALFLQVYDNLLYKHHQDQNDIRGNLAKSWTVSDDGMVWVFQIKEDAYFTSGNQVKAESFVKTWDVAKEYQPRFFAPVEKYEATGEFELTITLKSPSATFIYDLPMQPNVGVVDPAGLEQYGGEDNRAAIGAGPYSIESYTSGQGFVLKANPKYHNPDRAPSIETCEIVLIPDVNTALLALMNNEIQCLNTVSIEVYNTLKDDNWQILSVLDRVNPYWFNAREVEIFRDDVVREALCHMIDWQAVTDLVYDGLYPVSKSYWEGPGMVPYSDKYKYDPELGLKMLKDAGYKPTDIAFTLLADPDFTDVNIAIQGQFHELGLTSIEAVTYDGATCYGMLKGGTYEMFPVHNGYGRESPLTVFSMGLVPTATQKVMWLDYIDEARYQEALQLYDAANVSPNFETYLENVEKLTTLIQDECLAMGGLLVNRFYILPENIKEIYPSYNGYIDFCYLRIAG